jgi:hypothetical protein
MLYSLIKQVFNLEEYKGEDKFKERKKKLFIYMLWLEGGRDSWSLCSRVASYIIKKDYIIFRNQRLKLKRRSARRVCTERSLV